MSARARHPATAPGGFTLVELLVAIFIFAIMTAVAYRALTGVVEGRERVDREVGRWREVSLLFARMKQDLALATPRPVRDAGGLAAPPFSGGLDAQRSYGAPLVFSRSGETARNGTPAAPRRVGYRLNQNTVEFLLWPVLDQAPHTVALPNALLDGVTALEFRYLDAAGAWQESWPPRNITPAGANRNPAVPAAVQVTVQLESGDRFVRLFALPVLVNVSQ